MISDKITNKVLLDHAHGMKQDLQEQVQGMSSGLQKEMQGMEKRLRTDFKKDLTKLEQKMSADFKGAIGHRDALQEDLVATMQDTINIRRHVGMPVG